MSSPVDLDEYEEVVFAVELKGLFDERAIMTAVEEGRCRVANLDGEQPLVQAGSNIFVGTWESTLGTDLVFKEIPHRQMLSFIGASDKRLVAQRVVLNAKKSSATKEDDVPVNDDSSEDVTVDTQ